MKSTGKYTENEFIGNLQLGYDKMKSKGFTELKTNSIACYTCFCFLVLVVFVCIGGKFMYNFRCTPKNFKPEFIVK